MVICFCQSVSLIELILLSLNIKTYNLVEICKTTYLHFHGVPIKHHSDCALRKKSCKA